MLDIGGQVPNHGSFFTVPEQMEPSELAEPVLLVVGPQHFTFGILLPQTHAFPRMRHSPRDVFLATSQTPRGDQRVARIVRVFQAVAV